MMKSASWRFSKSLIVAKIYYNFAWWANLQVANHQYLLACSVFCDRLVLIQNFRNWEPFVYECMQCHVPRYKTSKELFSFWILPVSDSNLLMHVLPSFTPPPQNCDITHHSTQVNKPFDPRPIYIQPLSRAHHKVLGYYLTKLQQSSQNPCSCCSYLMRNLRITKASFRAFLSRW